MRRKKLLALVATLAITAGGIALDLLPGTASAPPIPVASPVIAVRKPTGAVEISPLQMQLADRQAPIGTKASSAVSAGVAPAQHAAVLELIADLHPQAMAGEPAAVCRLVAELMRCRMSRNERPRKLEDLVEAIASSPLTDDQIRAETERLVAMETYQNRVREACHGVGADDLRRVPRYMLASAKRGHVSSMVGFASAVGVGGEDIVADPELYALYREHAASIFEQAFATGHPRIAFVWHGALASSGVHFLAGVLPDQWRTPEVAQALVQILHSEGLTQQPPPPTQISDEALRQADALFQRHFANSRWRSALASASTDWSDPQARHEASISGCADEERLQ